MSKRCTRCQQRAGSAGKSCTSKACVRRAQTSAPAYRKKKTAQQEHPATPACGHAAAIKSGMDIEIPAAGERDDTEEKSASTGTELDAAVEKALTARRAKYRRRIADTVAALLGLLGAFFLTRGTFRLFTGPAVDAVPWAVFTGVAIAAAGACHKLRKKSDD